MPMEEVDNYISLFAFATSSSTDSVTTRGLIRLHFLVFHFNCLNRRRTRSNERERLPRHLVGLLPPYEDDFNHLRIRCCVGVATSSSCCTRCSCSTLSDQESVWSLYVSFRSGFFGGDCDCCGWRQVYTYSFAFAFERHMNYAAGLRYAPMWARTHFQNVSCANYYYSAPTFI